MRFVHPHHLHEPRPHLTQHESKTRHERRCEHDDENRDQRIFRHEAPHDTLGERAAEQQVEERHGDEHEHHVQPEIAALGRRGDLVQRDAVQPHDLIIQRGGAALAPQPALVNRLDAARRVALANAERLGEPRVLAQVALVFTARQIERTRRFPVPLAPRVDALAGDAGRQREERGGTQEPGYQGGGVPG